MTGHTKEANLKAYVFKLINVGETGISMMFLKI